VQALFLDCYFSACSYEYACILTSYYSPCVSNIVYLFVVCAVRFLIESFITLLALRCTQATPRHIFSWPKARILGEGCLSPSGTDIHI